MYYHPIQFVTLVCVFVIRKETERVVKRRLQRQGKKPKMWIRELRTRTGSLW